MRHCSERRALELCMLLLLTVNEGKVTSSPQAKALLPLLRQTLNVCVSSAQHPRVGFYSGIFADAQVSLTLK